MHVLVTGGTGFIGRALCAALLTRAHRVSVLTRDPAAARRLLPGVEVIGALAELRDDRPDGIVNLAGQNLASGRWTAARKQAFVDSRVGGTRELIRWLHSGRLPQVLVSGSAIGWYGARGDEALDEQAAAGSEAEFSVSLCRAWEAEAAAAQALGVRTCLLRTGIVLERDGGSLQQMLPPFRLGLGGPIGSGQQWMSWIHRADLVGMIVWLLETPAASGPYNGTAPQPVRNREFVQALGRALHRPARVPMPGLALRLLIGEMADIILSGQRVLPMRARAQGYTFRHPDLDSALAAILSEPAA